MSATIDGATITLLVELGDATLVLGRDVLGDVMNGPLVGAADITCEAITASWTWGAAEYRRKLTVPETGRLTATIIDETRRFDPTNEQGPYYAALRRDRPVRVLVGADVPVLGGGTEYREYPAWTGKVKTWRHDWMTGQTTLVAYDALDEAGRIEISTTVSAGTPAQQAARAATAAGVSLQVRSSYADILRSTHNFHGTFLEALADCRFANHGHYWVDRSGRYHFSDRSLVGSSVVYASPFQIGCDPYPGVAGIEGTLDRAEIVNGVRVDRFDANANNPLDPYVFRNEPSIAAHGPHYVSTSEQELDLEPEQGQAHQAAYAAWAAILLDDVTGMGLPEDEINLTEVIAEGLGVLHLTASDYMAPFILRFPGVFGRRLNLYGLRADVSPDGWSFSLVTGPTFGYPPNTEAPA